ncbi:MAG: purine-binding chemotaxis protein CheW [Candidatus Omnitrophica bacterium]|nr:purine-binding chemotaxis protein CheW [Candidatus Omnitrophota bacterium]
MIRHETTEKKTDRQFLVFSLQGELMGFPIGCVREVLRPQQIHPLVHAPDFVEGVIYVRKSVLVVLSLRKRFGLKANEDTSKERIIICKVNTMIIGLAVDSVSEVLSVSEKNIMPPPEILAMQNKGRFVLGLVRLNERVITLLDLEKIVTREELSLLSGIKP